jgi:hypothetical protein
MLLFEAATAATAAAGLADGHVCALGGGVTRVAFGAGAGEHGTVLKKRKDGGREPAARLGEGVLLDELAGEVLRYVLKADKRSVPLECGHGIWIR